MVQRFCRSYLTAAVVLSWLTSPLAAHSWYDAACCGQTDCRPVSCEDLVEIDRGLWKYLPTNAVFGPEQIHPSKDRSCHVCLGLDDGRSICAYIQTNM